MNMNTLLKYNEDIILCPVCQKNFEIKKTARIFCPYCLSRERHRIVGHYIRYDAPFSISNMSILHVAPVLEGGLNKLFLNASKHVLSIDIKQHRMVENVRPMSVEDLKIKTKSIDLIMCSHVLEHIKQPMTALREFARVMKRTGRLLLMVPMMHNLTNSVLWTGTISKELASMRQKNAHIQDYNVFGRDVPHLMWRAGFASVSYDYKNITRIIAPDNQILYIGTLR